MDQQQQDHRARKGAAHAEGGPTLELLICSGDLASLEGRVILQRLELTGGGRGGEGEGGVRAGGACRAGAKNDSEGPVAG